MISSTKRLPRVAATFLTTLGALWVGGCGDDSGLPTRYPVSGVVKYKGAPVPKGRISFVPVDNTKGRAADGAIDNGNYRLTTASENDGALPGSYRVAVIAQDVDYSQVQANAKGGAGRQDDIVKANKSAKDLVPSKYQLPDTSGLKAEVKAERNTLNFDLPD